MELNQMIDVAQQFKPGEKQASMEQDNANKADFALRMVQRISQEQPQPEQPAPIPSLGALAVPN